jgi:hypothetical protein
MLPLNYSKDSSPWGIVGSDSYLPFGFRDTNIAEASCMIIGHTWMTSIGSAYILYSPMEPFPSSSTTASSYLTVIAFATVTSIHYHHHHHLNNFV